jgi:5-methylcytosine-specific restriction endonuclease McrA
MEKEKITKIREQCLKILSDKGVTLEKITYGTLSKAILDLTRKDGIKIDATKPGSIMRSFVKKYLPSVHGPVHVIIENKKVEVEITKTMDVISDKFLESFKWRKLRMQVLKKYGSRCMCCGSTGKICVDHIKCRKKFPELALEITNLQVLCEPCNHGKGNWDSTDWRPSLYNPKFYRIGSISLKSLKYDGTLV